MALTQRSFARESVELALAGDWTTSKSEKVSEMSVLNKSNAGATVSESKVVPVAAVSRLQ